MTPDVVVYALRVAIGSTFVLAATGKVRDLSGFAASVSNLTGVSMRHARPLAVAVVAAEALLAGTLLAVPALAVPAFAAAGVVLVTFAVVLVRVLRRTYRPACNCFGTAERPVSGLDVVRNGLLAAGCLAGALLAPTAALTLGAAELALVALPSIVAGVAVAHLHDVVSSLRRPLPHARLLR